MSAANKGILSTARTEVGTRILTKISKNSDQCQQFEKLDGQVIDNRPQQEIWIFKKL